VQVIKPALWQPSIDYLRLTHKTGPGFEEALAQYVLAAEHVAGQLILEGYSSDDWTWMGYSGKTWGQVSWGEGRHGAIVQASGVAAQMMAEQRLPWTGVPRIDVQVTYWLGADFRSLAAQVAEQSDRFRRSKAGRPWKVRLEDGKGDGDTCYIGSRGSKSKFLRCYDKWRESGQEEGWRNAWRFEAELTDSHGEYALSWCEDCNFEEWGILALCAGYWEERGIVLPEVPVRGYVKPSVIKRAPESVERVVQWLETQVAPALSKAAARGLTRDQMRAILGL
jgi:DNA relaxase NicK